MPLTPDAMTDLVKASLPHYEKKRSTVLTYDLQDHVACRELFGSGATNENHQRTIDSGYQFEWRARLSTSNNARMSGLFAEESTDAANTIANLSAPWRKIVTSWKFDTDEKEFQSTEATQILDQIAIREEDGMTDRWKLVEEQSWRSPASPSADEMLGIPFWITACLAGEEGFKGLAASGHTTVAGLNPTTYERWRNWAADYSDVSFADFMTKVRTACYKTTFTAPDPVAKSELGMSGAPSKTANGFYTVYNVVSILEELLRSSNDNIGMDLAKYAGKVMIKGSPVTAVPQLDVEDSSAAAFPFYGLNWSTIKGVIKKNRNGTSHGPVTPPMQPTVRIVYRTWWQNIMCVDRRRNFRLQKV